MFLILDLINTSQHSQVAMGNNKIVKSCFVCVRYCVESVSVVPVDDKRCSANGEVDVRL